MELEQAQRYVLALINRDRARHDLEPVSWDDTAADAGMRHAQDMARTGFTAHWGSDGSVPEQRYSEAGGRLLVQENAACFFDNVARELDPKPTFEAVELERIQSAFYNEVPPNDGHRKNILGRWHNRVGVGLAKPVGIQQPCMAQEFADDYGTFDDLPEDATVGQQVTVAGEVREPVRFGGVGIARIEAAAPMPPEELNQTSTYQMPRPYVMFFPPGFKTPKPVQVDGRRFSIEVPLDDGAKPGRYLVSVWGAYPGAGDELVMISLRSILVR